MKSLKISPLLFTLLCYVHVWAGDKIKNGGDVVVCASPTQTTYEVLDLVEAKIQVPPLFHIVDHRNMTFEEANARLLLRIEKWNPTRAKLYRDWLQSFFSEVRWLPAATFTDLKDEGDGKVFPNNCELRQAVLQWRKPDHSGGLYVINRDLWDKLAPSQQSALVFHELIYRELTQDDRFTETSAGVRYFNAFLHSEEFETSRLRDYIEALQQSGLKNADVHGYPVLLNSGDTEARKQFYPVRFHSSDRVLSAIVGNSFLVKNDFNSSIQCVHRDRPIRAFFSPTGTHATFVSDCQMQVTLRRGTDLSWALADSIEMESNEEMSSLQWGSVPVQQEAPSFFLEDLSYRFIKRGEHKIYFWKSGQVSAMGPWRGSVEMNESYVRTNGNLTPLSQIKSEWICLGPENQLFYQCQDIKNKKLF